MKITILGTGAIGSLFAAGLAQNHDLTCVVGTKSTRIPSTVRASVLWKKMETFARYPPEP